MKTARSKLGRRAFLKRAGTVAGAAVAAPYVITSTALGADGRPPASERIVMGAIGVGGRGHGNMRGFMGPSQVQMVACCDPRKDRCLRAKASVDGKYGNTDCVAYNDFRDLVSRDDIDAVCIGTPDHWHALTSVYAMRNGKDVFCEKPMTLTIPEGRIMVATARRYGRVFSCGSQRVLGDYGSLARYVRSGAIGTVREVFVSVGGPSRPSNLPAQPVPDGLDWDMWLGPAPYVPFNNALLNFRPWRDYSGGGMTDWGGHKFGAVIFAMDLQETGPVEVLPPDGKDRKLLTYRYANGMRMYHGGAGDITYVGDSGRAERRAMGAPIRNVVMPGYRGRGGIQGDFLHCVRTRQRPFRDVEFGHRAATVCHLGNLAYRLKRPLKWDPVAERFINDDQANRMMHRPKRGPWVL